MAVRLSQEKSQVVTAMRAHQLLGHPSYQAIEHLQDSTTGLKVGTNGKGDQWTDNCVPCIQGKMKEGSVVVLMLIKLVARSVASLLILSNYRSMVRYATTATFGHCT
jgi:hypothetical protein